MILQIARVVKDLRQQTNLLHVYVQIKPKHTRCLLVA